MSDIEHRAVLYMPKTAFVSARDDIVPPLKTIATQVGNQGSVAGFLGSQDTKRLRCVVCSALTDSPVEGISLFANHTNASAYPVVPDANNRPTRQPNATNAGAGNKSIDWIDAPPNKSMASVGIWATNRPAASFYGLDIGLSVQMVKLKTVLQLSLINGGFIASSEYWNFSAALTDLSATRKSDQEFYDYNDDHPMVNSPLSAPNAIKISNKQVKVSVRSGPNANGTDLYVFLEEATST